MSYKRKSRRHRLYKRKSHRRQRGGAMIGKGGYGCVWRPSLRCKNETKRRPGISKLLRNVDAEKEMTEYKRLSALDPYHLGTIDDTYVHSCEPQPHYSSDKDIALQMVVIKKDGTRAPEKCLKNVAHWDYEFMVPRPERTLLIQPDLGSPIDA